MDKEILFLCAFLLSVSFVNAGLGYNNPSLPKINAPTTSGGSSLTINQINTSLNGSFWKVGITENVDGGTKTGAFSFDSSGTLRFQYPSTLESSNTNITFSEFSFNGEVKPLIISSDSAQNPNLFSQGDFNIVPKNVGDQSCLVLWNNAGDNSSLICQSVDGNLNYESTTTSHSFNGDVTTEGDITVLEDTITLGNLAGMNITGINGTLTLKGGNGTQRENLLLNFNRANQVLFSSTTGVNTLNFSAINLRTTNGCFCGSVTATGNIAGNTLVLTDGIYTSGVRIFDPNTQVIYDSAGLISIDANFRQIYDPTGNIPVIDYGINALIDTSFVNSVLWESRSLRDSVDFDSVVWGSRYLANSNSQKAFQWATADNFDFYGSGSDQILTFHGSTNTGQILYSNANDYFNFKDDIAMQGGENIILSTVTGTKIGTATNQLLGFFNANPVAQQSATTDLGVALSNLGLRGSGNNYLINTTNNASIGNLNVTNNVYIGGNLSVKIPSAMYSSTQTQTIAVINTAYPVTFNWTEDSYQINKASDNANFSVLQEGKYEFIISAIAQSSVPNTHVEIWVQKNAVNVPRSNTIYEFKLANSEAVITVPFEISLNKTDVVRIMFASDNTGTTLIFKTNTSYSPQTPSIIMNVKKISDLTP